MEVDWFHSKHRLGSPCLYCPLLLFISSITIAYCCATIYSSIVHKIENKYTTSEISEKSKYRLTDEILELHSFHN